MGPCRVAVGEPCLPSPSLSSPPCRDALPTRHSRSPVSLYPDRPSKILLVQVGTRCPRPIPPLFCQFSFFLSGKVTTCPK